MGMLPKNLFKKPNNPLETYDKYNKSASPDIPSEMCVSCPNCRAVLLNSDLSEAGHVCPKCGHCWKPPLARMIFSVNAVNGKILRCPRCGSKEYVEPVRDRKKDVS